MIELFTYFFFCHIRQQYPVFKKCKYMMYLQSVLVWKFARYKNIIQTETYKIVKKRNSQILLFLKMMVISDTLSNFYCSKKLDTCCHSRNDWGIKFLFKFVLFHITFIISYYLVTKYFHTLRSIRETISLSPQLSSSL